MTLYKRYRNTIQLLAVAVTVLTAVGHRWLPQKTYEVTSHNKYTHLQLHSSNGYEHGKEIGWVDREKMHMHCTITSETQNVGCGLEIMFYTWPNWNNGLDLANYDTVHFEIRYKGTANKIRFYARNYHANYSKKSDFNSAKYNTINLRTRDLAQPVDVPLNALVVADWWLDQFDIPLNQSHVDFSNITAMGFDFGSPIPHGVHDIHFKKIVFKGDYISSASWYLIIITIWMLTIAIQTLRRLMYLREKSKRYQQRVNVLEGDKSELKLKTEKLEELSSTDSLTGAYNRFGIDKRIAELYLPPQARFPITLIIIDIDHFKYINDNRGHAIGDRVLSTIGRTIAANIRESDFLGRWGGEEFIVVCEQTDAQLGFKLAEKLRGLIAATQFELDSPLQITASFGVGEASAEEDFKTAFERVDNALYRAKNQGRNCSVLATTSTP